MPASRVIGSGTILDRARFRSLLGSHLPISPRSIHAYVLGERGDSQVPAWSCARAGAVPIAAFGAQVGAPITEAVRAEIDDQTRNAAYRIIEGKGSTYYGIAAGLARIVGAIRQNEQVVLTVSAETAEVEGVKNVALSVPRAVGRDGITAELFPDLDPGEHAAPERSASHLRGLLDSGRSLEFLAIGSVPITATRCWTAGQTTMRLVWLFTSIVRMQTFGPDLEQCLLALKVLSPHDRRSWNSGICPAWGC